MKTLIWTSPRDAYVHIMTFTSRSYIQFEHSIPCSAVWGSSFFGCHQARAYWKVFPPCAHVVALVSLLQQHCFKTSCATDFLATITNNDVVLKQVQPLYQMWKVMLKLQEWWCCCLQPFARVSCHCITRSVSVCAITSQALPYIHACIAVSDAAHTTHDILWHTYTKHTRPIIT